MQYFFVVSATTLQSSHSNLRHLKKTITIANAGAKNCAKAKKCANTGRCANIIRWVITLQLPHPTLQHLANRQDTDVLPPDIANIHYAKEIQMSYIQNTEGLQRQSSLQGGSNSRKYKMCYKHTTYKATEAIQKEVQGKKIRDYTVNLRGHTILMHCYPILQIYVHYAINKKKIIKLCNV